MKKQVEIIVFTVIIYSLFIGVGYLVSLVFKDLQNVYSNAMLLSFGLLFGSIYHYFKTK